MSSVFDAYQWDTVTVITPGDPSSAEPYAGTSETSQTVKGALDSTKRQYRKIDGTTGLAAGLLRLLPVDTSGAAVTIDPENTRFTLAGRSEPYAALKVNEMRTVHGALTLYEIYVG